MGYKRVNSRVKSILNKYEEKQFQEWMEDGNVIEFQDGYATQDAQYGNRLKDLDALRMYFYKEFIKGQYAVGGRTMGNRAKKQARKDIKTHFFRPQAPYQSIEKPSEEWERYELPYDTKTQYDFEPDSFSAEGKRYSEYATGGEVGDLIKFKNLDNEVLVGRINNVLGENRYSVSSGFGSFLVDKSNYVGEVETPAPRKKFLGIFADGGQATFDVTKLDLDNSISSRVYYTGVDDEINKILQNDYKPVYDFDKKGIEWVYKNTRYESKDEDLIQELKEALAERNRGIVDMMRLNKQLPIIESKYGKDVNFAKKMHQQAKDFYQNKLWNEKSIRANEVFIDYLISRLKESKKEFADGGEAGFDDAGSSMVLYHEKKGNFMFPKGQVYLYLYDVEGSVNKLENGEFDWVFYPYASLSMMGQSGFIPPLKKIWTKKFQKDHKGSEHLLGVIKAFLIEKENGEKELYIDMMSVNPTKKKKGIMSYMIKELRDTFNLSQDQVTFSDLTEEGKKFVAKKTYADGGDIPHKDKMFQLPLEMVVYVPSTQDVDKVISVDEMEKRVNEVKKYLASKFGGYTSSDKLGGYVDSTGKLVNEDIVQVVAFSTKESYQENKEELINKLSDWASKWGQEAIGFEFEGDLMYVPQKFKKGGDVKKKLIFTTTSMKVVDM